MEVGEAVTYVDTNGKTQNALVAKIVDGKANLVVVNANGADDAFGKNRGELRSIPIGSGPGYCSELDAGAKPAKSAKKKKE